MNAQADKSRFLPLLIAGMAVVLFSTAGIARMMGWGPNLSDDSGDILAPDPAALAPTATATRARRRCPECGMVVSMREIERRDEVSGPGAAGAVTAGSRDGAREKSNRIGEIIVRMADGSSRVIEHASLASWRPGERVIVIGGAEPSHP